MTYRIAQILKYLRHLRFIRNPVLASRILAGYYRTLVLKQDRLRSIELAVTYHCQASCHKCYAANLKQRDRPYLSVPEIREIVNQAMKLGLIHINLTGGEPSLRQDLLEIIRACRPGENMVSLVTHAFTLTRDSIKALKKAGLNTMQISLDSADRETHDRLRGITGCYDKALQAAGWARESGINLCFSTVLSTEDSSNTAEMEKLLLLAEREKAFLLICDSAAVGGWDGQSQKMMTCEERDRALEKLLRHPRARHHAMYNFRGRMGCPAGTEKIYITAYGDVTPCDLIHDVYGNALKEPLELIWKRMCDQPLFRMKTHHCVRYLDEAKLPALKP